MSFWCTYGYRNGRLAQQYRWEGYIWGGGEQMNPSVWQIVVTDKIVTDEWHALNSSSRALRYQRITERITINQKHGLQSIFRIFSH